MTTHKILVNDFQEDPFPSPTSHKLSPSSQCRALHPPLNTSANLAYLLTINPTPHAGEIPLVVDLFPADIVVAGTRKTNRRPQSTQPVSTRPFVPSASSLSWNNPTLTLLIQIHKHSLYFPATASLSFTSSAGNYNITAQKLHTTLPRFVDHQHQNMPSRRRSLQSFLIPTFFNFFSHNPVDSTSPPPPSPTPSVRRVASATGALPPPPPPPPVLHRHVSSFSTASQVQPVPLPRSQPSPSVPVPRCSPPPDYLHDDDPFADLTRRSHSRSFGHNMNSTFSPPGLSQSLHSPRSPLSSRRPDSSVTISSTSSFSSTPDPVIPNQPSLPTRIARTLSSGPLHARPAHLRPAFSQRPSLPSLHSLAQTSVTIPKVRSLNADFSHVIYFLFWFTRSILGSQRQGRRTSPF